MSEFVCQKCNAYLGLSGTNARQCPKCEAPIVPTKQKLDAKLIRSAMGSELPDNGKRDLWVGGIWFISGFVLTGLSYMIAVEYGHRYYYVIWWPVVLGGLQFIRGLQAWDSKRSAYEEFRRLNPDLIDDGDDEPIHTKVTRRGRRFPRKPSATEPIIELTQVDTNTHAPRTIQH